MLPSSSISGIFAIAAAIIGSLGGGGLLVFALSSWLGRIWATRIMEREKAALITSIEAVKAELTRSIEREKAEMASFHETHRSELQELSTRRQDALNRKRDVYAELATKMRILLRANITPEQQEQDKWAFLGAYDKGYVWASEPVITAIGNLIETVKKKAVVDNLLKGIPAPLSPGDVPQMIAVSRRLDAEASTSYQRCMLEMRKDAGYADSTAEYQLVSFG